MVKREMVRGWEPGAIVVEELLRFRPLGTPPPVVGVADRRAAFLALAWRNLMLMFWPDVCLW